MKIKNFFRRTGVKIAGNEMKRNTDEYVIDSFL